MIQGTFNGKILTYKVELEDIEVEYEVLPLLNDSAQIDGRKFEIIDGLNTVSVLVPFKFLIYITVIGIGTISTIKAVLVRLITLTACFVSEYFGYPFTHC
ncbi:MAG: hypothetical protein LBQ21_00195 [Clostridiales Family XIII bacterium]|jgi:hypothetical protein|nr:hypothetical protein [Clostridiales Family XIII bacterium]